MPAPLSPSTQSVTSPTTFIYTKDKTLRAANVVQVGFNEKAREHVIENLGNEALRASHDRKMQ